MGEGRKAGVRLSARRLTLVSLRGGRRAGRANEGLRTLSPLLTALHHKAAQPDAQVVVRSGDAEAAGRDLDTRTHASSLLLSTPRPHRPPLFLFYRVLALTSCIGRPSFSRV